MKEKTISYLYNFFDADDGDGSTQLIHIDGFPVEIGINVVILPGFHIHPSEHNRGKTTTIGSHCFLGNGITLEEGSVLPEGTILQGKPLCKPMNPIKVIIAADDFGRTKENNKATECYLSLGLVQKASLMVDRGEDTKDALRIIENGGLQDQIALHFNLTEGHSLSPLAKDRWYSVNAQGNFGQIVNGRRSSFFLKRKEKIQIKDELKLQIETFVQFGLHPTFFDSHGHIHNKWPIAKLITPLLKNAGFTHVRLPRRQGKGHLFYDFFFKRRVINLYRKNFETTDAFINASDLFDSNYRRFERKTIEIMAHPFIKAGKTINRRDIQLEVLMAFLYSIGAEIIREK